MFGAKVIVEPVVLGLGQVNPASFAAVVLGLDGVVAAIMLPLVLLAGSRLAVSPFGASSTR